MRCPITCIISASIFGGTLLSALPARPGAGVTVQVVDAAPLTGIAWIPADADVRSIRLEGLKLVRLPSRIRYTSDSDWCDRAPQEPGGSAFCPQVRMESPVTTVELTYSYSGDNSSGLTFQVYFRPSDLPPALTEALAARRKPDRAHLANYFELTTRRDPAPRYIFDPTRSFICSGTYIDGNWEPDDPDCDIIIRSRTVQGLSDFLTIKVTPRP